MTWARHTSPSRELSQFEKARALAQADITIQHDRAARTVASHAMDAEDCSRLLAMLGLGIEPDDPTGSDPARRTGPGVGQDPGGYPWSGTSDGVHRIGRRRLPRR